MKRIKGKGYKSFAPMHTGRPNVGDMHRLDKSPHSMNDYSQVTPLSMTKANMPTAIPTPAVTQFAQKGVK